MYCVIYGCPRVVGKRFWRSLTTGFPMTAGFGVRILLCKPSEASEVDFFLTMSALLCVAHQSPSCHALLPYHSPLESSG